MEIEVEMIQRLHIKGGVFLEVGTFADAPSCVEVRTVGKENEDYFGKLSLTLEPELAVELARALQVVAASISTKEPT
jgi:hypothetical protein